MAYTNLIVFVLGVLFLTLGFAGNILSNDATPTARVATLAPERIYCAGETAPDWHSRIEVFGYVQGASVTGHISLRGQTNSGSDLRMPASGFLFRLGNFVSFTFTWQQPEMGYYPVRTLSVQGEASKLSGSITYYPIPGSQDELAKKPMQQVEKLNCNIYGV